ncbi:hypothetical protein QOT17_011821 [Balamuthia mandrillaris]
MSNSSSVAYSRLTSRIWALTEELMALLQLARTKTLTPTQVQLLQRGLAAFCCLNGERARFEKLASSDDHTKLHREPWSKALHVVAPGEESVEEKEPTPPPTPPPNATTSSTSSSPTSTATKQQQQRNTNPKQQPSSSPQPRKRKRAATTATTKWHLCVPFESEFQVNVNCSLPPSSSPQSFSSTTKVTTFNGRGKKPQHHQQEEEVHNHEAEERVSSHKRSKKIPTEEQKRPSLSPLSSPTPPKRLSVEFLLN